MLFIILAWLHLHEVASDGPILLLDQQLGGLHAVAHQLLHGVNVVVIIGSHQVGAGVGAKLPRTRAVVLHLDFDLAEVGRRFVDLVAFFALSDLWPLDKFAGSELVAALDVVDHGALALDGRDLVDVSDVLDAAQVDELFLVGHVVSRGLHRDQVATVGAKMRHSSSRAAVYQGLLGRVLVTGSSLPLVGHQLAGARRVEVIRRIEEAAVRHARGISVGEALTVTIQLAAVLVAAADQLAVRVCTEVQASICDELPLRVQRLQVVHGVRVGLRA